MAFTIEVSLGIKSVHVILIYPFYSLYYVKVHLWGFSGLINGPYQQLMVEEVHNLNIQ